MSMRSALVMAAVVTFGGLTSTQVIAPEVAVAAETGTISEEEEIASEGEGGPYFVAPSGVLPTPVFPSAIDDYAARAVLACDPVAKPGVLGFREIVIGVSGIGGNITRSCTSGVGVSRRYNTMGLAFDWSARASSPTDVARVNALLNWLFETDEHGNPHARIRRLGIVSIIWNDHAWSADRPSDRHLGADIGSWRTLDASSCFKDSADADCRHMRHVHFIFSAAGGAKSTTWWTSQLPPNEARSGVPAPANLQAVAPGVDFQRRRCRRHDAGGG